MTGEITLRGRVLKIGGLKEKVIAAHRNGIKRIILPADNVPELEEISKEIRRDLEFIPVKTVDDVLRAALVGDGKPARKQPKTEPPRDPGKPRKRTKTIPSLRRIQPLV
jgi:ATP-dependent Lon protease